LIKPAATFQNADAKTRYAVSGEILGKSWKQAIAILGAIFAALLELDDLGADEPVAEN